jgi:uncharacterized DUF497 family protein
MYIKDLLEDCIGFEWDQGNILKNWVSHEVTTIECEEVFFNTPLILMEDLKHSINKVRFYALGKTDNDRKLFIAFTIRNNLIRIISARDMSRKEKRVYEER